MKEKILFALCSLSPLVAFAELDPITLRDGASPNKSALARERSTVSPRESAESKLAAYDSRDEAWTASVSALAVFPRRADWDFTGGAELGFGYDWRMHRVELSAAIFQSHSNDYAMYQTAIPLMLGYTYSFAMFADNTVVPYVSLAAGTVCNDYLHSGTHSTHFDLGGSIGCGLTFRLTDEISLRAGYRFSYVQGDEYKDATGMGGGHVLNLGLDFRF